MSLWSKSKSSQNISRDRALSTGGEEGAGGEKIEKDKHATLNSFQVTSKDNVPVHPKAELPAVPTTKASSGDVVLTISKTENKVKEYRDIELKNGHVTVTNLPSTIVPQTVRFVSISDSSAKVLTQVLKKRDGKEAATALNFLCEQIGQVVTVNNPYRNIHVTGVFRGATSDSLFVSTQENKKAEGEDAGSSANKETGVCMIPLLQDSVYSFPHLTPATFTTNLEWTIGAKEEKHFAEISYACSGLAWTLNFNGLVDSAFSTLHLTGWYQLENKSGTDFNAKIIVVENSAKVVDKYPRRKSIDDAKSIIPSLSSFKKGGDSDRYSHKKTTRRFQLPRIVRLPNDEVVLEKAVDAVFPIKRFYLAKARKIKFSGTLDTDDRSLSEYAQIDSVISFENTVENGLGLTLPAGTFQVAHSDEGDDSILDYCNTTLRLEEHNVLVKLTPSEYNQFSLLRKRTSFHNESKRNVIRETFDITIDNDSPEPRYELYVEENMFRWSEWEVTGFATSTSKLGSNNKPVPFTDFTCQKHDLKSHRVAFYVPIVPDYTTITITYTAVYNYSPSLASSS